MSPEEVKNLEVKGYDNIYTIGDCDGLNEEAAKELAKLLKAAGWETLVLQSGEGMRQEVKWESPTSLKEREQDLEIIKKILPNMRIASGYEEVIYFASLTWHYIFSSTEKTERENPNKIH